MSNIDQNENPPAAARKQLNTDNYSKLVEPHDTSKSRKSSQNVNKDLPKQGLTKLAAMGSSVKKTKKNSSIEPPQIMSQSQINSQMVAINLKKRSMAPSKKGSQTRVTKTDDCDQAGSKQDVTQQIQNSQKVTIKPIGSLFQSQKDEEEDKFPQIQASEFIIKCNLSSNVNERGLGDSRIQTINQDMLKIPKSPKEGFGSRIELRERRRSQGINNKSQGKATNSGVKSQAQTKQTQITQIKPAAIKIKNLKKTPFAKEEGSSVKRMVEQQLSPRRNVSKNKRLTAPVKTGQLEIVTQAPVSQKKKEFLCSIDLQTPTAKKVITEQEDEAEVQLEVEDSKSDKESKRSQSSDSSNEEQVLSDDSEEDQKQKEQQKKEDEAKMEEMKAFAENNGFKIEFEKKKEIDIMEQYAQAAKFKITKELLDEQEKLDTQKLLKRMVLPPPLELLKKKYTNREPIRTGFNEGLLPVHVKNNYEMKRTPQGPQIVITTTSQSFMERQRRMRELSMGSREKSSRKSHRSVSRDSTRIEFDSKMRDVSRGYSNLRHSEVLSSRDSAVKGNDTEEDGIQVKEIIQANPYNSEASLRHLFYLEYKKKFADQQTNPIVYSRFGKSSYNSDEKFDPENFNQLIRTCNIKKILKLQDCQNLLFKKERKLSEPVSFPTCDYYTPTGPKDQTLVFESRFESGNLQLANKISDNEYDLVLQNDINSKGHTQWFYFRVSNVHKGLKVKFNMLNMIKPKSLYNDGMKVLIYSEKRQQGAAEMEGGVEKEGGWHRGGDDIGYFQNNYKKEHQTNFQRYYYTFTFSHTFEHDEDQVYFAYSIPYTYTELTNYLCEIESRQLNYVTRNTLCRTIAGNKCEYLTITNRVPFEVDQQKEGVVFTGRIHPGESNSSLMMKGIIDFLVSSDPKAHELREKFVFKIIPMLNPDGVINGNYRCSLAGCDLNRRWKYPSEILHPTIYHTKKLIARLATERPLALYCDLHGHSRRKNVFMYGNNHEDNPKATRIFPFLMSKLAQPHFSYDYSKFSYCRTKEQTGRIAVWRDLGSKNPNIFTMEASFCGPKSVKFEPHRGNKKAPTQTEMNYHFISKDYSDIGTSVCETLLLYRKEKESKMGFCNVEYLIDQYHIEKEAKIEQEDLIRQQQVFVDQRKQQELQKKVSDTVNALFSSFNDDADKVASELPGETSAKKDNIMNSEKKDQNKSVRKLIKKAKTESVAEDITKLDGFNNEKSSEVIKKKQAKYNLRDRADESDAQSDSEPSEDNLEEDQICKLIPKKWGKKRYLKGVDEKKKKVKQETPKKPEKKPKTMLMPCMSHKKNEDGKDKKRDNSESVIKKIRLIQHSISKTIASRFRNGVYVRDIATHIKYKGDGKSLSLMELDILNTTGCKWSRIIYPGYKGPKVETERVIEQPRDESQEKQRCSNFFNNMPVANLKTPVSKFNNDLNNSVSEALRQDSLNNPRIQNNNHLSSNKSILTNEIIKQTMENDSQCRSNNTSQFAHERRSSINNSVITNSGIPASSEIQESNQIDKLKKKITEGNFSEARSLFKGLEPGSNSSMKNKLRQHAFDYSQKKILSDSKTTNKMDQANIYDLNLETVQERVNDKSCMTLDVSDLVKGRDRNLSYNQLGYKKIVNGEVQQQSDANTNHLLASNKVQLMNKLDTSIGDSFKARQDFVFYGSKNFEQKSTQSKKHHSMNYQSRQCKASDSQQQLGSKLSFSNVAQQILLNNSSCDKKKNLNNMSAYEDVQQQYEDINANTLVGRNGNINFANYKSVQQTSKQRRGSMFKDQFENFKVHIGNSSQLSMNGAAVDTQQFANIGQHLVNQQISGGGSISQLSAGISIKNFNEGHRKQMYKNNNVSDMLSSSVQMK